MSKVTVVGLRPWLPWPFHRSPWWTAPLPAERLAALRIGVAGILLIDVLTTYLPHLHDFFGAGSLGAPGVFPGVGRAPDWRWSVLRGVEDQRILLAAAVVWALSAACLLAGFWTRVAAVVAWLLTISFTNVNPFLENAGDEVRAILLFYLMLSPCGAAWSLDRWRREPSGQVLVHPWPLRLLFLQMTCIYFSNGLYKVVGDEWRAGESLYYVLADLTLSRWSYAQLRVPFWLTRLLSWAVLAWELSFPLLVALPWLGRAFCRLARRRDAFSETVHRKLTRVRVAALGFGAAFHVGIGISMELGWFAAYMLCFYLPLLPWERLGGGPVDANPQAARKGEA